MTHFIKKLYKLKLKKYSWQVLLKDHVDFFFQQIDHPGTVHDLLVAMFAFMYKN